MSKIIFEFDMPKDEADFEIFSKVLAKQESKPVIDVNRIVGLIETYRPEYGLSESTIVNLAENICELVNKNVIYQKELLEENTGL